MSHSRASHPAGNFSHPYLAEKRRIRKEFGLGDLFLFKIFGCFSHDELPPPNLDAPIFQKGRSSSATMTSRSLSNTTASVSAVAPSKSNNRPNSERTHRPVWPDADRTFDDGLAGIVYRRPLPDPPKRPKSSPSTSLSAPTFTPRRQVVSTATGENVSKLSAMFDRD